MKTRNSTKLSRRFLEKLKRHALNARRSVITASAKAGSVHIASALSPIDIMVALYFDILRLNLKKKIDHNSDKFILSKGHGALGFYSVLAEKGIIPRDLLDNYGKNKSILPVHPVRGSAAGVEATTGSLGHGLGMGLGMALAQKSNNGEGRTFILLSDGECDEGSTWESVMLAGHLKLDNLIAIVDYNKIQAFGSTKEVLDLEPFTDKWRANRWDVEEVDGHDFEKIISIMRKTSTKRRKPMAIIAHTIKGKGVPFMENKLEWHYKNVKTEDLEETLSSIY